MFWTDSSNILLLTENNEWLFPLTNSPPPCFSVVLPPLITSQNLNLNGTRGGTILWPCKANTPFEPSQSRIYWQTEDPVNVVHVYNKGKEEFNSQNKTFANRTTIFLDQLPSGNFSLLFDPLSLKDDQTSLVVVFQPNNKNSQKICQQTLYVAGMVILIHISAVLFH